MFCSTFILLISAHERRAIVCMVLGIREAHYVQLVLNSAETHKRWASHEQP